jgi:hypothetical protein
VIPSVPGISCSGQPPGPTDCSVDAWQNDWHLHNFMAEPANAPGGGKAHGGLGSLHMGRHLNPANASNSTYRFRQLTAFVGPSVNIAITGDRALEYWQIVRLVDDNVVNTGAGEAMDLAMVQVRLDENSDPGLDDFGPWQRIEPVLNPYDHLRDSRFPGACKFDPTDDFFDPTGGGRADETTCHPQSGWSDQGEGTGSGVTPWPAGPCLDSDHNGHNDCGSATKVGPGYAEVGAVGTGVWMKTRFDLASLAGRRAQFRWLFSSIAFFENLDYLSYNETPGNPGAFDMNEFDDGWYIDDICFSGLLNNQLNLILDGGDDVLSGSNILCGNNLVAETVAEGDDVQVWPVGAPCVSSSDLVVHPGANGQNDSVGTDVCPSNQANFCLTATAAIHGQSANPYYYFSTGSPGQEFVLDAWESSLSSCINGNIQFQFLECHNVDPLTPCSLAGSANLLQDYSSDGDFVVYPTVTTRYQVNVRCSSQILVAGCTDSVDAIVLVPDTSQCGTIHATGYCRTSDTGSTSLCDPGDSAAFDFPMPEQVTITGVDLYATQEPAVKPLGGVLDIPLIGQNPYFINHPCSSVLNAHAGVAAGTVVTVAEPPGRIISPALGDIVFYLVACSPVSSAPQLPVGYAWVLDHSGRNPWISRWLEPTGMSCP